MIGFDITITDQTASGTTINAEGSLFYFCIDPDPLEKDESKARQIQYVLKDYCAVRIISGVVRSFIQ